jgi:hypothetical protein
MDQATRKRQRREAEERRRWSKSKERYWHVSVALTPNPHLISIPGMLPFLPEKIGLSWNYQTPPRNHFNMRRGA